MNFEFKIAILLKINSTMLKTMQFHTSLYVDLPSGLINALAISNTYQ